MDSEIFVAAIVVLTIFGLNCVVLFFIYKARRKRAKLYANSDEELEALKEKQETEQPIGSKASKNK